MKRFPLPLFLILATLSHVLCNNQRHPQSSPDNQQNLLFPFQKKLWTYWNSDTNQIPLTVKICLDNLQSAAKKHNFAFVCLNQSNVQNYITNYDQQFLQVRNKSIQKDFAHAADLLRVIIIQQQGGIWVDSTTVFLNGMAEIQNIMSQKYAHMITNRFSPQPDMLFFFYSFGQSRIQRVIPDPKNSSETILYNENPNNQIWFIASKKQSPLIKEIKRTYAEWTTLSFNEVEKKLRDEDIYMNRIDDFGNYLYLNMVVSYILQRKQSELDKQVTLFGERKTSFEEYKVWSLHSEYGPMIMIREDLLPLDMLFLYSNEEFKTMGWDFKFFMKQFGYFRYYIGWYLDNLIEAFKDYDGTLEQWMKANPDPEYCEKLTPIVEGSIFHKMLLKSTVINTKGIKIFSKQQLQQWEQYCAQNSHFATRVKKFFKNSIFHSIILRVFMYDKIHKAKIHEITSEGQQLSFFDWIKIKYADNQFLLFDFGYFSVIALLMFWMYEKIVSKITSMLRTHQEKDLNEWEQFPQDFSGKIRRESVDLDDECVRKNIGILRCLIFVVFLCNLTMYNAVDLTGGRQQPQTIFLLILFTFLVETYIEKQIQSGERKYAKFIEVRYQYEFFYLLSNYITAYLGLVFMRRNRFWLNWFGLVIGCVGPCVMRMVRAVIGDSEYKYSPSQNNTKNGYFLVLGVNQIRFIVMIVLALVTYIPNLKFISTESGHILKYLPIVPVVYIALLYLFVLAKTLNHKNWLELSRLIVIGIVVAQLCWLENNPQYITNLYQRIVFISRTLLILQAVYLQTGTSLTINNFHQFKFMKSFGNQLLFFIAPFAIQFLIGRFYWEIDHIMWNYSDYSEHLLIYCFSSCIAGVLSQLQKIEHQNSIQTIESSELEYSFERKKLQKNDPFY